MKFKLDENLGTLGKTLLASDGHDVLTVVDQEMSGASDERVYEICREEGRVLVTLDHDFAQTLRFPPDATAGIVVLECKARFARGYLGTSERVGRVVESASDRT